MEKAKKRPSGLCGLTPQVIQSIMYFKTFTCRDVVEDLGGDVKKRRVGDVLAVLYGAGFIEKTEKKKHYKFVGIQGTRDLYDSLRVKEVLKAGEDKKHVLRHYGTRLVQLFVLKDEWEKKDLRMALFGNVKDRRFYDVISVFYGVGLVEKNKEMITQRIKPSVPRSTSRVVLTVSDEDAVVILPELKDHLFPPSHNTEVITF